MDIRHPDEGTLLAFVEDQLPAQERERIAAHVAACADCAATVAEARGLIAAASRVVGALDDVPAGVLPARQLRRLPRWVAAAAVVVLSAGVSTVLVQQLGTPRSGDTERLTVVSDASSPEVAATAEDSLVRSAVVAAAPTRAVRAPGVSAVDVPTHGRVAAAPAPEAALRQAPSPTAGASSQAAEKVDAGRLTAQVATPDAAEPSQERRAFAAAPAAASGAAPGAAPAAATERAARTSSSVPVAPPSAAAPAIGQRTASVGRREGMSTAAADATGGPTRAVTYEVRPGLTITLYEYPTANVVKPQLRNGSSFMWRDAEGARTFILTGPLSEAELERLAHQLGQLRVVP